jgi:glycosyltransferase involved in cell wall biosynthesis
MADSLRIAMILSGLGRVQRGAEAAFLELARQWVGQSGVAVTLFGSGQAAYPEQAARHVTPCQPRERFEGWPRLPTLRTECYYEELSYVRNLARSRVYRPDQFDVVVSCTYPWVNWYLRRAHRRGGPVHVYVTQNGDWPCHARAREGRFFRCDGLVCTNPVYFERNRQRYPSVLIPNGVDPERFRPRAEAPSDEADPLGPTDGRRVVLIASAQVPSKDVAGGVRAVAEVPDVFLAIAGDGPEREAIARLAAEQLTGRHRLLGSVPRDQMPALFRRADAFLHMSRDEPSALVYAEAAASGLPCVVHDRDVTRWTLGDAAVYVDTADPASAAAGLREALDPANAARLGQAARRRVLQDWSWPVLAGRYLDFFRERLAAHRPLP